MTYEMKLLRSLIDALGFEIETTEDIKWTYHPDDVDDQTGKPKENATPKSIINTTDYKVTKKHIKPSSYIKCNKCGTHLANNSPLDACLCGNSHNLERTNSEPINCVVPCVPLPIQSKAWGCIVEYCSDHEGDIEIGINDFATLRPIWEFMTGDRLND